MRKIASPEQLQTELKTLLAYASKPNPKRRLMAAKLLKLAEAVEGVQAAATLYVWDVSLMVTDSSRPGLKHQRKWTVQAAGEKEAIALAKKRAKLDRVKFVEVVSTKKKRKVSARVKTAGRLQYHAQPYDTSATGFYFRDFRDFDKQYKAKYKATGVEEYELEFIDGPRELADLFQAAGVSQGNLKEWDDLVDMEEEYWAAAFYLLDVYGEHDLRKVMRMVDDFRVMEGDVKEYVEEFVDSMGGVSELGKNVLEMYFDWDSYARDMELNGDVKEFRFGGKKYVADPNSI